MTTQTTNTKQGISLKQLTVLGLWVLPLVYMAFFVPRADQWSSQLLYFVAFLFYLLADKEAQSLNFYAGLLLRLILLFALPWLSDDYFRFLWDGRLLSEGLNPFLYRPEELQSVLMFSSTTFDQSLYEGLNSASYFSVYPPINQWVFALAARTGSIFAGVLVLKLVLLMAELGVYRLLVLLLKRYRLPINKVNWYWLNPLVAIELVGNAHFEGLMLLFVLLSVWSFSKLKSVEGAIYFCFSVLSKVFSLMLFPLLFWKLFKGRRWEFAGITVLGLILCFSPFMAGGALEKMFTSFDLYFRNFEFNNALHSGIRWLSFQTVGYDQIQLFGPIAGVCSLLLILLVSWLYRFRNRLAMLEGFLLINTIYLFFSPIVHPWYLVLILAFSLFTKLKYPIWWSAVVFLSYSAYHGGVVEEKLVLVVLEYLSVLAFLLFELRHRIAWSKVKASFL